MKKLLTILIFLSILPLLATPVMILNAQTCNNNYVCEPESGEDITCADCQARSVNPIRVLTAILNLLFTILMIVAAIFIIIAAYYFVTAQGNAEDVKKAREFVLYALIGVLVGLMARGLVWMVQNFFPH